MSRKNWEDLSDLALKMFFEEDVNTSKPKAGSAAKPVSEEEKKKEELGEHRIFTRHQKELCWNQHRIIKGRDPDRWRFDPIGNPVLKALRGCHGALCHEYDHIVPFSKGGKTTVENCQIL